LATGWGEHGPSECRVSGKKRCRQLAELPLSREALVLTPMEHAELLTSGSAMAAALQRDSRWLWHR
jgi:hypothetical protein